MFAVTLKGSVLFVVVMALLSATQTESIADLVVVFLANGVIPGTNFILPAEIMLVTVALALMIVAAAIFRSYTAHQAKMRALIPNYDNYQQDPSFSALVPGLGRLLTTVRAARMRLGAIPPATALWTRYAVSPASAQAAVSRGAANILLRTDRWAPIRIRFRLGTPRLLAAAVRKVKTRALAYAMRVSSLLLIFK